MNKKILVVEDDGVLRDLYENILKNAGFDVTTAPDGEEALFHLKKGGFSLVLLDMMIPKKDGIEVLKDLKESPPQTPNGHVILLTNLAHKEVIDEAMKLGAHSYLIKTDMTPDQLLERIKHFLES